jgi:uncharacterized protein YdhG (YjbR/CyaY superfamily)
MGASKNHCGLNGSVLPGFKEALKDFKMGKGSIRFTPQKPISADVLKALLRAKAAEIEVRWPNKGARRRAKMGWIGRPRSTPPHHHAHHLHHLRHSPHLP